MEPMLDMFIFESLQLLGQLENTMLVNESKGCYDSGVINEIFRIMHTIKGSASMMMFDNIATLAHSLEDLFFHIREFHPENLDNSLICDMVLESIDFIKSEVAKLDNNFGADGESTQMVQNIKQYLTKLKGDGCQADPELSLPTPFDGSRFYISTARDAGCESALYQATLFLIPGCEMENLRAFNIVHKLQEHARIIEHHPPDIIENNETSQYIIENGFFIVFEAESREPFFQEFFNKEPFVDCFELIRADNGAPDKLNGRLNIVLTDEEALSPPIAWEGTGIGDAALNANSLNRNSIISVNVNKLDKLMDMVGELVTSEAMVTLNPDLAHVVNLDNFLKAARQHRKIINELQDIVMSIRMVPLSTTFQKMNRIVRDMGKKLNKNVSLEIIGEETEVDKNIIEHLSDPLMHMIRNAIDHGIESREERIRKGKPANATIRLEAKNEGGDVFIIVRDDGAGLNKDKILARARAQGLLHKPDSELTDGEIYSTILQPGFSTRDEVSEYSGRGVGMDVVARNIEAVGGTVLVDSSPGQGTSISLKIPLTLAIINGMQVKVGDSILIIPITSIRESFKPQRNEGMVDPDNNEMIMVRGDCLAVLRLHQRFSISTTVTEIEDGIIIIVEYDSHSVCLFADSLLGEQQVVVKAMPRFIGKIPGISGCTLLGDGRACLILDIAGLVKGCDVKCLS